MAGGARVTSVNVRHSRTRNPNGATATHPNLKTKWVYFLVSDAFQVCLLKYSNLLEKQRKSNASVGPLILIWSTFWKGFHSHAWIRENWEKLHFCWLDPLCLCTQVFDFEINKQNFLFLLSDLIYCKQNIYLRLYLP